MSEMDQKAEALGFFERYLTVWVFGAICVGIAIGALAPGAVAPLASFEVAGVNLLIAILIWAMVWPMMISIDFGALAQVAKQPKGLFLTLTVNWLIKPFTMALLAVLFLKGVFGSYFTEAESDSFVAGLILLGAAPCTAMVFVWSQLTKGDAGFTLIQVSVNDAIMTVAFAPIVALLLGVAEIAVPWSLLILSVVLYVLLPLAAGIFTRSRLLARGGEAAVTAFTAQMKPLSVGGLIATVVLLFAFQGGVILSRPVVVAMIAVPIIIQAYLIFAVAYGAAKVIKLPHAVAAPAALIGTSNFFELAVAVAIGLYGLNSGAALATVVGVLVEVPVMLSLVAIANRTRGAFPDASPAVAAPAE